MDFLGLVAGAVEDKIEVVVGMAIDGPCPGVVDDVLQDHCMARVSGSTPAPAVAYLRLLEEGSCTTLGSRLAACGGDGLAVGARTDWTVRA